MLRMSDALVANLPERHGDRVVDLNCLTEARRQFVDIDQIRQKYHAIVQEERIGEEQAQEKPKMQI
jgi:hypothetical protein